MRPRTKDSPLIANKITYWESMDRIDKMMALRWLTLWVLLWAATTLSACGAVGLAPHPSSATSAAEPLPLSLVGRIGGPALAVATKGQYTYVGYSFEFAVVDLTHPAAPHRLGYLLLSANDIEVSADFAYVAARDGLQVVNIEDPTHPRPIGFLATAQPAVSLALAGHYAYLVAGDGLHIVALSAPNTPLEVGFVSLPGRLESVAVTGSQAYVATSDGLRIVDIADPAHPTELAVVSLPGYAEAVTVVGRYAYVAAGNNGLQVLDVSHPANPAVGSES
jgi:hypothetical protein